MAQNNLDVGMRCIKYMLLCVTAIFVITSALIISVGTTIFALYYNVATFLDDNYFSPATFVVVIGVIMLFVSLFGCIGALKESTCLVNMFAVILSLVLVLELAAAIAAYSLRNQLATMLDTNLRASMPYYYNTPEVQEGFDFLQFSLRCCGIDDYQDWANVPAPPGVSGLVTANITVPNSCCAASHYEDLQLGDGVVHELCDKMYVNGCLPRIYFLVYQSAGLLGAAAMTIAFIQIIGIVFSFSLARAIRRTKSERLRRRYEIQQRVIDAHTKLQPTDEKNTPVVYVPFHGQTNA